jgi:hypothetical protein
MSVKNGDFMEFLVASHRNGHELFRTDEKYASLWTEIENIIWSITEADLLSDFSATSASSNPKSISYSINRLLKDRFLQLDWKAESFIFAESEYRNTNWRLDFAKEEISVEVGFNHGGNVAWNLIKPVLASELNHVKKDVQTSAGVIITATDELRILGGFDNAIGTYEKYVQYLKPLQQILPTPLVVIGLQAPKTFHIEHIQVGSRKVGKVVMNA